jgi:hypothetical protein
LWASPLRSFLWVLGAILGPFGPYFHPVGFIFERLFTMVWASQPYYEGLVGISWGVLGCSWSLLWCLRLLLGVSCGFCRASWLHLVSSEALWGLLWLSAQFPVGVLGCSWSLLWCLRLLLGVSCGALWGLLWLSAQFPVGFLSHLGPLWAVFSPVRVHLRAVCRFLKPSLAPLGRIFTCSGSS